MGLTLLLTLAGLATPPPDPPSAEAARQDTRSAPSFRVEPLHPGPPAPRPFQLLPGAPSPVTAAPARPGETQLHNRRTGVTCTMRIIRVAEPVDPGMPIGSPPIGSPHLAEPDASVRNDLSPCSE